MPVAGNATPLVALDALALDLETTGLDARKASIVEIALVPLSGGQPDTGATAVSRVRPPKSIPRAATRIHGIDDAAVAGAPAFAEVWPGMAERISSRVVIGHSIGYDLAVLRHECARAGVGWKVPRALCVRLLAERVAPDLPDYSLERLADWLGVEAAGRHSAAGDAVTAARIFVALVPRLRERGVRTLAEAERACSGLSAAREAQHRAGWVEAEGPEAGGNAGALLKLDSYPYRHHVRDVMSAPARFIAAATPLSEVVRRMAGERVSSFFVTAAGDAPAEGIALDGAGILTERDILRCVAARGAEALGIPAGEIASRPLVAVPAGSLVFVAMARMNSLKVRHLAVIDDARWIIGALSARDLLRLRAEGSVALGDEIFVARDVPALGRAWARLPEVAAGLVAEGMPGREIAVVVSHQLCALTERAAVIAEERMRSEGRGNPPCAYVLAVLGSAGRGESLLAMDQDNALIFADGGDEVAHDAWFAGFGKHVADILNEVGVPYCKGGIMVSNPQWRGSVSAWRERIAGWVRRSRPQDLLAVDIFFDMRGVHGDLAMAEGLWREAFDAARGNAAFAKLLAASIGEMRSALTLFGGIRADNGRIDVKQSGLFGVVSAARALAIWHHIVERSTQARLAGLKAQGRSETDLDALGAAQEVFLDLMVAQQVEDIRHGISPSNKVELKRLSSRDRDRLRSALSAVSNLNELVRDLLFKA